MFRLRVVAHFGCRFRNAEYNFQLGYELAMIDLHTGVSGLDFGFAFQRRTETTLDGVPITLLCREDLRRNKLATGRLRDLGDVEALGYPMAPTQSKGK